TLAFGAGSTGKFQLNGFDTTVVDLNTNATVGTPIIENGAAGTATLTDNTTGTDTYAGVLQDGAAGILALIKSGAGSLTLSGANTYSGGTTLSAGTLNINNASALGTGTFTIAGGTTIDNTSGGALSLTNAQTRNGDFPFTGSNNLTFSGNVALGAATRQVTVSGGTLTESGVIGGTGGLTKAGAGTMVLSGSSANTYSGLTTVSAGTLILNKAPGVNAIVGDGASSKVIDDILVNGGTLSWAASNQVDDSVRINVTSGAVNFGSANETLFDLENSGGFVNYGTGTVNITDPTWSGGTNEVHGTSNFGVLNVSGDLNTVFGAAGPGGGPGTLTVGSTGGLNFSGA